MTTVESAQTIYALSTPFGKSGVAIIRVSGNGAKIALNALGIASLPSPRIATLATLLMQDGTMIDRALVLYFPAPNSFTGENIVEFHVHGGRSVIRSVLDVLGALPGLRPAEAGEFMRRAFLNGKMDLTAAEGLADLIDAETESQRRQALRLMQGEAAVFFDGLRAGILHALAYLEAYIDFPDEEIPPHVLRDIEAELVPLAARIGEQLAKAHLGQTIREGIRIAIIGPPNAGKSSLINMLARRDVAIVSPLAGTTRDVLEAHLDLKGYSVTFVDTAGIREHRDAIEQEGIRRSFLEAEKADIKILLLDSSAAEEHGSESQFSGLVDARTILVYNKADIASAPSSALSISVLGAQGIDKFLKVLEEHIEAFFPVESVFVTRQRHQYHLTNALKHIHNYLGATALPLELQCEELRGAALEIGKITGTIAVDELLGHIFSSFCIGK
jgi:tRNA modification GTPase